MHPLSIPAYNLGRVTEQMLTNVLREISKSKTSAMESKCVKTVEVFFRGARNDVGFGQLHIIPPSACNEKLTNFPRPLLRGLLRPLIINEDKGRLALAGDACQLCESESDTPTPEQIKLFKEQVFPRAANGQFRPIMVFIPYWCSVDEMVFIPFEDDEQKMRHNLLTLLFKAFYNPSLSSLLDVVQDGPGATEIPANSLARIFETECVEDKGKTAGVKRSRILFTAGAKQAATKELEALTPEEEEVIGAVAESLKDAGKKASFLFTPGQVLQEFYPETQQQMLMHPMDHGDGVQEALPNIMDFETADVPSSAIAPKPLMIQEQIPLRQEMALRGPGFVDQFYRNYVDINPMRIASAAKTAGVDKKTVAEAFLKQVCGSIAATLIGGFHLNSKLPVVPGIPAQTSIDLGLFVGNSIISEENKNLFTSQLKEIFKGLNDGDVRDILDKAWAQGSIWNNADGGAFVWELLVRAEALDVETLNLTYKVVINKK